MKKYFLMAVVAAVFAMPVSAQFGGDGDIGGDLSVYVPPFDVRMSIGFNYDILRSLTDVSFDKPMGYLALDLPFGIGGNLQDFLGDDILDEIFDSSGVLRRGSDFKPTAYATQNDNYTVRVDMPMLGGVGSFAYTQNFFFNLSTNIGGSSIINEYIDIEDQMDDDSNVTGFVSLKGALRLPLDISMGWETMTFGYAHRVAYNDNFIFAFNLHRHLFNMNLRMNADIDLLGHAGVESAIYVSGADSLRFSFNDEIVNFNADDCNGLLSGRYRVVAWTPSFGVRLWRFSLDSRFGFKSTARGSASGKFIMPKIVDLDTWEVSVIDDPDALRDSVAQNPAYVFDMIPRELDSIVYEIGNTMHWEMPSGHTIGFDIIRNKLSVSYTKLFGDLSWRIEDIRRVRTELSSDDGTPIDTENDTLRVDMGVKVDHVLLFHLNTSWLFGQIGVAGVEFWSRDSRGRVTYALRDVDELQSLRVGDVAMVVPILGGGVDLGASNVKVRLEMNIFPLPALRTGIRYNF